MSYTVQHKRSDTSNRRPLPTELENGQVAVNYNNDTPGLYFRTSTDALSKAGPPIISASRPLPGDLGNYQVYGVGELWINTSTNSISYMAASGNWTELSPGGSVSLATLQSVTAASTDFADFQTRIAAL